MADMKYISEFTGPEIDEGVRLARQYLPPEKFYSNPYLIINPWFTVNQRGFTSGKINGYTVDKWTTTNANAYVTVDANGLSLKGDGGNAYIQNRFPFDQELKGKIVTFSVMLQNGDIHKASGVVPVAVSASTQAIAVITTISAGTAIGLYLHSSGYLFAQVGATNGNTISLRAVKVEYGSVSTLANDHEPDYATELLKCQRYYFNGSASFYRAVSCVSANCDIFVPVHMRDVAPSIAIGPFYKFDRSSTQTVTSTSIINRSENGIRIRLYGNSFVDGFVQGVTLTADM